MAGAVGAVIVVVWWWWLLLLLVGVFFAGNGSHVLQISLCVSGSRRVITSLKREYGIPATDLYDIFEIVDIVPLRLDQLHDDAIDV